jgi:hypothetical protein
VTFEYKIATRRGGLPVFRAEPASDPVGRPPRVVRLVALAHRLEALIRSGEVEDYVELAALAYVSPARIRSDCDSESAGTRHSGVRSVSIRRTCRTDSRARIARDRP